MTPRAPPRPRPRPRPRAPIIDRLGGRGSRDTARAELFFESSQLRVHAVNAQPHDGHQRAPSQRQRSLAAAMNLTEISQYRTSALCSTETPPPIGRLPVIDATDADSAASHPEWHQYIAAVYP